MSAPTAEQMSEVERAAEGMGLQLMPWQRELAALMLNSTGQLVYSRARRGGVSTTLRVCERVRELRRG